MCRAILRGKAIPVLVLLLASCTAANAAPDRASVSEQLPEHAAGEEYIPCEGCPVFVRVPNAPGDLRPIRYVSKFELTWNNYLVAFDEGICGLPKLWAWGGVQADPITPEDELFPYLRMDLPITNLGPNEIECYERWLGQKTGLHAALPTEAEWEWFARSGVANRKFPWGDDPDGSREALRVNLVVDVLAKARREFPMRFPKRVQDVIRGERVGLFAPTEWGLHDVLGNVWEVTLPAPSRDTANKNDQVEIFVLKGYNLNNFSSKPWPWLAGIDGEFSVAAFDNRFSASAGIRLTLIDD